MPDDCPFCKRIAAGDYRPTELVDVVSFEPLNPVTQGHLLFVPRAHVEDAKADPRRAGHAIEAAALFARYLADDVNLITSVGPAATQTVRHLHVHLVPRREGDGLALPWTDQGKPTAPLEVWRHEEREHPAECAEERARSCAEGDGAG